MVGGLDGVTGANQFEARGAPDGLTVLLVPGQAVLAWMVGDPRAQFDVGHWVPVMAGVSAGLSPAGRRPGPERARSHRRRGSREPRPAGPARLGAAGRGPEPVFGLTDPAAARNAFAQGAVDAVFLRGHGVPERLAALAAVGAQQLFTLGVLDDAGQTVRDPGCRTCRILPNCSARAPAAGRAARCTMPGAPPRRPRNWSSALVLPQLTPAAMVSLWRRAGREAAATLGVQTVAASLGVRPLGGPAATASTAAAAAPAAALRELRRWLAGRFNWHPA